MQLEKVIDEPAVTEPAVLTKRPRLPPEAFEAPVPENVKAVVLAFPIGLLMWIPSQEPPVPPPVPVMLIVPVEPAAPATKPLPWQLNPIPVEVPVGDPVAVILILPDPFVRSWALFSTLIPYSPKFVPAPIPTIVIVGLRTPLLLVTYRELDKPCKNTPKLKELVPFPDCPVIDTDPVPLAPTVPAAVGKPIATPMLTCVQVVGEPVPFKVIDPLLIKMDPPESTRIPSLFVVVPLPVAVIEMVRVAAPFPKVPCT
jgi:hypothetical protein